MFPLIRQVAIGLLLLRVKIRSQSLNAHSSSESLFNYLNHKHNYNSTIIRPMFVFLVL